MQNKQIYSSDRISSITEQYLKNIFQLHRRYLQMIPMKKLVEVSNMAGSTVTAMVKSLHKKEYLYYTPHKGVRLTEKGRQYAIRILRRHRLLELFLNTKLGYDWSEVHEEAEVLEHAVSDKFIDRIDLLMGSPHTDPHGDPIPNKEGELPRVSDILGLLQVTEGSHICIHRIVRTNSNLLRFLKEKGLIPGEKFLVKERNDTVTTIELEHLTNAQHVVLSYQAAAELQVILLP